MPRGVTDQFLKILAQERRAAIKTMAGMGGLSLLAYFMAEMTDGPLVGAVVALAILSLVLGLAAGAGYAYVRTKRYGESLRASWNQWMRMSLHATRVDEVARQVELRGKAPALAGVGWTALFAANALLFWALWVEAALAPALGAAVTVANGLVLGTLAGQAAWSLQWSARFSRTLHEMVGKGEIGMWGEV